MSTQFAYPTTVEIDKGGFYFVNFPDIPGASTDGESLENALFEAADCLAEALAGCMNRGEDIPEPGKKKKDQYLVPVPPELAGKLALYVVMRERNITNTTVANLLGVDEKIIRRLLDPQHKSKIEKIEQALEALGKKLVVGLQSVA